MRDAGTPQQHVWRSALDGIVPVTAQEGSLSPCVIIVGQVAALAAQWQEALSLL